VRRGTLSIALAASRLRVSLTEAVSIFLGCKIIKKEKKNGEKRSFLNDRQ
jgi:hypothetical protein